MGKTLVALLVVIASGISIPARADEATTAKELAKVQGKWVRTMTTPNGTFKVVKEHIGNQTTVTFLDSKGRIAEAKKSEFRLEHTGKVRIFTFFNNVITAGPQKGRIDNEPHSYIYRVVGDTFVEVNGLLIDDAAAPVTYNAGYAKAANKTLVFDTLAEGARVMGQLGFVVRFNNVELQNIYEVRFGFDHDTRPLDSGTQPRPQAEEAFKYLIRKGILNKHDVMLFTQGSGGSRWRGNIGVLMGLNRDPAATATNYGRELAHELLWHQLVHGAGHPQQGGGDLSDQVDPSLRVLTHEMVLPTVATEIKAKQGVDVPPSRILGGGGGGGN